MVVKSDYRADKTDIFFLYGRFSDLSEVINK